MSVEIFDVPQNSPEWHALRTGLVTASEMKHVLAKGEGKMRRAYMMRLAGERILGAPAETYENGHIIRGREMEDEARRLYVFANDVEIRQVGFIRNGDVGFSPDGLLGDNAAIEIKTMLPHILIDVLLRDRMPPEHYAQVQGGLMVSEREYVDFIGFWPGLPQFVSRQHRDEAFIKTLAAEIEQFQSELAEMVERVRNYGMPLKTQLEKTLEMTP
jgi:hypothetical protein